MTPEVSRKVLEKYSNIKFHENPSTGSRTVPCGRTDTRQTDGRTHITKTTVAFRNFSNFPKMHEHTCKYISS